jgi:hypothetical protein
LGTKIYPIFVKIILADHFKFNKFSKVISDLYNGYTVSQAIPQTYDLKYFPNLRVHNHNSISHSSKFGDEAFQNVIEQEELQDTFDFETKTYFKNTIDSLVIPPYHKSKLSSLIHLDYLSSLKIRLFQVDWLNGIRAALSTITCNLLDKFSQRVRTAKDTLYVSIEDVP